MAARTGTEQVTLSGAELLRRTKEEINEVDPKEVHEAIASANGSAPVIVDVREQHEFEASHLPGAGPRSARPPRDPHRRRRRRSRLTRDPLLRVGQPLRASPPRRSRTSSATRTSSSMTGGITLWKDRGYEVETPRRLTAEQRERYSRHILVPEIGLEGQLKLLDAKVLLLGAGGLGSPTALYLAAAGVGTIGIVDDDVVDLSNLQRQVAHSNARIGEPKVDSAEVAIKDINPDVERRQVPDPPRRLEHHGDHRGLRRDRRRRRQLPDALPPQRRDGAAEDPGRLGLDPRLRRPAVGLRARTRARATAASTRRRRRPSSHHRAARTACSERCRA